MEDTRI